MSKQSPCRFSSVARLLYYDGKCHTEYNQLTGTFSIASSTKIKRWCTTLTYDSLHLFQRFHFRSLLDVLDVRALTGHVLIRCSSDSLHVSVQDTNVIGQKTTLKLLYIFICNLAHHQNSLILFRAPSNLLDDII